MLNHMLIFKHAQHTFKLPKVFDRILADEKSDCLGLKQLAVLYRPAMARTPRQRWPNHFHRFAQFVFQRKRRIDHKHATGRQTGRTAVGVPANRQSEVEPWLL